MLRFLLEFLDFFFEIRKNILAFGCQFNKRLYIIDVLDEPAIQLNILFEPASPLQNRLCCLLIVPEFRLRYFSFEFENFRTLVIRIKDTLAPAVFFLRWRSLFPEAQQAFIPPILSN
jgi:hypothetical protein